MLNQAKAVIQVTKAMLGERYNPSIPVKSVMTQLDRLSIINGVMELFRDGQTGFAAKESNVKRMQDARLLREYVVGLCNNHWRKHKELNGGVKFIPSYTKAKTEQA